MTERRSTWPSRLTIALVCVVSYAAGSWSESRMHAAYRETCEFALDAFSKVVGSMKDRDR